MLPRTSTTHRTENAFTIVELMMVVVMIGVVAAIAIPSFFDVVNKAHADADKVVTNDAQQFVIDWAAAGYTVQDGTGDQTGHIVAVDTHNNNIVAWTTGTLAEARG